MYVCVQQLPPGAAIECHSLDTISLIQKRVSFEPGKIDTSDAAFPLRLLCMGVWRSC